MDGDLRYAAIREQIAARHDIARLERTARAAGARRNGTATRRTWSNSLTAVVGTLTRHAHRRPAST